MPVRRAWHVSSSLRIAQVFFEVWNDPKLPCSGLQNPFVTATLNEIDPRRTPQSCAISVRLISLSEFC